MNSDFKKVMEGRGRGREGRGRESGNVRRRGEIMRVRKIY